MSEKKLQEMIKDALATVHGRTTVELLDCDSAYQRAVQENGRSEERYNVVKGKLTQEQADVIESYIESIESCDSAMTDVAYIAGIRDTLTFLASYGLLK